MCQLNSLKMCQVTKDCGGFGLFETSEDDQCCDPGPSGDEGPSSNTKKESTSFCFSIMGFSYPIRFSISY